jgi:hypothetical protein
MATMLSIWRMVVARQVRHDKLYPTFASLIFDALPLMVASIF